MARDTFNQQSLGTPLNKTIKEVGNMTASPEISLIQVQSGHHHSATHDLEARERGKRSTSKLG